MYIDDTREVFDRIAAGWYGFRHRSIFTTELSSLAERWHTGRLLNIGCAHGPDFLPFRSKFLMTGLDISKQMLILARKYSNKFDFDVNLVQGDAVNLPFSNETFDFVMAVASFHHIPERNLRVAAFRELRRTLKPGGEAFVTVWNRWQPRFWGTDRNITVPWKSGRDIVRRFYHLYSYAELENDAKASGLSILRVFPESTYKFPVKMFSRNICLLLRK